MKTSEWLAAIAGLAAGLCTCWVRDKFMVLEYKVEQLENPTITKVSAEGEDGDPEIDDMKGQIGFVRSGHG